MSDQNTKDGAVDFRLSRQDYKDLWHATKWARLLFAFVLAYDLLMAHIYAR